MLNCFDRRTEISFSGQLLTHRARRKVRARYNLNRQTISDEWLAFCLRRDCRKQRYAAA